MEALVPDIFVQPTEAYQDQAGVVGKRSVALKSTSGCGLRGKSQYLWDKKPIFSFDDDHVQLLILHFSEIHQQH